MNEFAVSATPTRGRTIAYWITTGMIAFVFGLSGVLDTACLSDAVQAITELGYPTYFCVIIGVWKVLGAIAVLAPGWPRLKEWAYAGIVFDLTGAAASHFASEDSPANLIAPLVLLGVTVASWALRPPSRRLAGKLI